MRTFDLDPFWRSSIGFDRLFNLLNEARRPEPEDHYPPYDIVRTGENAYRILLAVAGFRADQLTIVTQENMLVVAGRQEPDAEHDFLYRGIANRSFERRFSLADDVQVTNATLADGLLQIELVREVPEAKKPRRIEIGVSPAASPSDTAKSVGRSKVA